MIHLNSPSAVDLLERTGPLFNMPYFRTSSGSLMPVGKTDLWMFEGFSELRRRWF
jgi:hypothetical protein